MNGPKAPRTAERTDPDNPAEQPILSRQLAAYVNALDLCVGRIVTELGCGRGAGTRLLSEVAKKVVAIDYDATCIALDRRDQTDDIASYIVAEVPPLPPAALRADVVICFQMIEHLANPTPLLQAMYDGVMPGGIVIISTPNAEETLSPNPYHLHEYTGGELQDVLEDIYDRVVMYSVLGDDVFQQYWAANKVYVQRILRLDPLRLHRYVPATWLRRAFDMASRITRSHLQEDGAAQSHAITPDNFRFEPGLVPGALDFYAVCSRGSG